MDAASTDAHAAAAGLQSGSGQSSESANGLASGSANGASGGLVWHFDRAVFDERTLELSVAGARVELERKPVELLRHLLRHAGEVVTREELLEAVWPDRIATEASLAKAVSRIRQELGDAEQTLIRTVHGYGYRLVAEVRVERPGLPAMPQGPRRFDFQPGMAVASRPMWQLRRHLGGGGQGEVWLAVHTKSGEQRVLKFVVDAAGLIALKREITLYRFLKETVGTAARCVRLIDWNLETEPFFVESEHIAGGSLPAWAAKGGGLAQLPVELRLQLLAQTAEAVAAAHSVGVLHRDLKPANLLIDSTAAPSVRIADFGSGGLLDTAALDQLGITRMGLTQALTSGSDTGTPLYRAPEVLAGQLHTVRADIYALGVMLYQLVIGDVARPLATGWEADVADPLLREDIALAAAGNPALRLADAADLAQRLRTLDQRRQLRQQQQTQRDAESRALAAAEQARQENERLKARRFWLRATVLALVAGLSLSLWLYGRAQAARKTTVAAAATAEAVTGYFTDDLYQILDADDVDAKTMTVKELFARLAARADSRFADQPEVEARVRLFLAPVMEYFGEPRSSVFAQFRKSFLRILEIADASELRALGLLKRMDSDMAMRALTPSDIGRLQALLDRIEQLHGRESNLDRDALASLRMLIALDAGTHRDAPLRGLAGIDALLATPAVAPERRWMLRRYRAKLLALSGQPQPALAQYREVLADPLAARYAGDDWTLGYIKAEMARSLLAVGQIDAAEPLLRSFADVLKKTVQDTSSANLSVQGWLGELRLAQGHYEDAVTLLDANRGRVERRISGSPATEVDAFVEVGSLLVDAQLLAGHAAAALAASQKFVGAMQAAIAQGADADTTRFVAVRLRHADALIANGDAAAARQILDQLPPAAFDAQAPQSLLRAERLRVAAALALASGDPTQARKNLLEATVMLRSVFGEQSWRVWRVRDALARLPD